MQNKIDLIKLNERILATRRQYGSKDVSEDILSENPFTEFAIWFEEALDTIDLDPCAMVLSTIDETGSPDSRVVLLLGLRENKFIFYTSYEGVKANQIMVNNKCAINFYWPQLSRQIRIKGIVQKIPHNESEAYFLTRDRGGQLAAYGALQSSLVKNREALLEPYHEAQERFEGKPIPCPENWGGYQLNAVKYEFFQGRDSRLHDRIVYSLNKDNKWDRYRIAP